VPVKDADVGYKHVVEGDELDPMAVPGQEPQQGVVWGVVLTWMGADHNHGEHCDSW
jgi:hypothetical protein